MFVVNIQCGGWTRSGQSPGDIIIIIIIIVTITITITITITVTVTITVPRISYDFM